MGWGVQKTAESGLRPRTMKNEHEPNGPRWISTAGSEQTARMKQPLSIVGLEELGHQVRGMGR